jgi:hypothetical protein
MKITSYNLHKAPLLPRQPWSPNNQTLAQVTKEPSGLSNQAKSAAADESKGLRLFFSTSFCMPLAGSRIFSSPAAAQNSHRSLIFPLTPPLSRFIVKTLHRLFSRALRIFTNRKTNRSVPPTQRRLN